MGFFYEKSVIDQEYVPGWPEINRTDVQYLRLDQNEYTGILDKNFLQHLSTYCLSEIGGQSSLAIYPNEKVVIEKLIDSLRKYTSQIDIQNIILTNGCDHLISTLFRAYSNANPKILIAEPSFPTYNLVAKQCGLEINSVKYVKNGSKFDFPYKDYEMALKSNSGNLIAVLVSPNNPTGSIIDNDYVFEVVSKYPQHLFFIDEAYFEFADMSFVTLLNTYNNVVIARTFSKSYGVAGLRIGFGLSNEAVIKNLKKYRGAFDVNSIALKAIEYICDNEDLKDDLIKKTIEAKEYFINIFKKLGCEVIDSNANFVLIENIKIDDTDLVNFLYKNNVLVRKQYHHQLINYFRATIPTINKARLIEKIILNYFDGNK